MGKISSECISMLARKQGVLRPGPECKWEHRQVWKLFFSELSELEHKF